MWKVGRSKDRKVAKLKIPKYEFGEIVTKSGLKIKYPKAFPLIETKKIIRNPQNIKLHSKEQVHDLAEQIKKVGFKDPVVLDEKSIMFGGHGRLDAAELLGMLQLPWYPLENMTEEEKKVFMIWDNKVNEAPWVSENLKIIFDEVAPIQFDNFLLNFDDYFEKNIILSEKEWQNMPEFMMEDLDAYRRIFVKFDNEEDIKKFAKDIKQNITKITKSIWYPYKPIKKTTKEYKVES